MPDEPPNKRRKKDTDSTPSKFNVDALADQRAIQKALADEEAKRQAALERQAAEAGDTRWVLSFEDQKQVAASPALALRVVQTGYANLDSLSPLQILSMEEEPEDKPVVVGRRSYGRFNKVLEVGLFISRILKWAVTKSCRNSRILPQRIRRSPSLTTKMESRVITANPTTTTPRKAITTIPELLKLPND
jgi:hypothetical protein